MKISSTNACKTLAGKSTQTCPKEHRVHAGLGFAIASCVTSCALSRAWSARQPAKDMSSYVRPYFVKIKLLVITRTIAFILKWRDDGQIVPGRVGDDDTL